MAMKVHTTDDGRTPGLEYLACGAITPKAGMALKLTAGQLAVAGGTDTPTYLSMAEREEACTAGELIPVLRIQADMVLETETPAAFKLKVGEKATLGTDGLTIAGGTGGCAEIVYTDEEITRVRFA